MNRARSCLLEGSWRGMAMALVSAPAQQVGVGGGGWERLRAAGAGWRWRWSTRLRSKWGGGERGLRGWKPGARGRESDGVPTPVKGPGK